MNNNTQQQTSVNRTIKIILISFPIVVLFCIVGYFAFDLAIAKYCNSIFSNTKIRRILKDISKLGIATFYLVCSAVIFMFFRFVRKREVWWNRALFVFLSISLSGVFVIITKFIFGRYRPRMFFNEQLYGFEFFQLKGKITSFPSGHSSTIVALMLSLYFISPKYRVIYFLIAFVVVISRVLVCHHYLTDVVVGSYVAIVTTLCLKQFLDNSGIAIQDK
jgi:membrane-associated phospholipid phosphatase